MQDDIAKMKDTMMEAREGCNLIDNTLKREPFVSELWQEQVHANSIKKVQGRDPRTIKIGFNDDGWSSTGECRKGEVPRGLGPRKGMPRKHQCKHQKQNAETNR